MNSMMRTCGRALARAWQCACARGECTSTRSPVSMTASHLAHLNPEQRRAVEFGGADVTGAPPLLIIAGAGSGKTNTLAHRVAHLVVSGVDPRRILLLTFSRRAAAEMTRRVERIAAHALRGKAGLTTTLSPGRAPFMPSARGCCANMRRRSGSTAPSPFTTARTRPI